MPCRPSSASCEPPSRNGAHDITTPTDMILNALAPRHHIGHLTLCEGAWQVLGECANLEDVRKLSNTLERGLGIPIASASARSSWRHASVRDRHAPLADPEFIRERWPQFSEFAVIAQHSSTASPCGIAQSELILDNSSELHQPSYVLSPCRFLQFRS